MPSNSQGSDGKSPLPDNNDLQQDQEGEQGDAVDFAFVFDIDGVLMRGGKPVKGADIALKILDGKNQLKAKVPYIFLTNSGGKLEDVRCHDLSQSLGLRVSTQQFIQSHTPLRAYAERFQTVLVVGGEEDKCRQIAIDYGFKDPVIPLDILKWNPSVTPFGTLRDEEKNLCIDRDFSKTKIDAIFIFADSRAWARDLQIVLELLTSKDGYMGTKKDNFDDHLPIFFSNPDVLWATDYDLPRYGMGALRKCIEALYSSSTGGKELHVVQLGKPYADTYEYAETVLADWRRKNGGGITQDDQEKPFRIYMVGDNPDSDIRGANIHGWVSCLVRTGVFKGENSLENPAKYVFDDVLQAVQSIVNYELEGKVQGQMDSTYYSAILATN